MAPESRLAFSGSRMIFAMRFTTYNIQFGRGLDDIIDLDRIAATVDGADVIALQEVERHFPHSGNVDQVCELARRLPSYHWVYGAGVDMNADQFVSDGSIRHRRQQFGNMLLSRTPILTSRNHLLPKRGSTGPLSIQRSALEAQVHCGATLVRAYSIHLTHISSEVRMEQVERIFELHRNAVYEGGPMAGDASRTDFADQGAVQALSREAILLGDFNFTPDSAEYDRVVGEKSDYGGRVTNPEGFVDAWVAAGNDEMSGVTAERRGQPVRMDYCFASSSLMPRISSAAIDSKADGSDHKPFSVVMNF